MLDSSQFLVRALLADGLVGEADITLAAEHAARAGMTTLEALVDLGIVSSRRLAIIRGKICECPFVDLPAYDIDLRNARYVSRADAERFQLFPLFVLEAVATVAMADPLDLPTVDHARRLLGRDVAPVLCDPEDLRALLQRAYAA